MRPLIAMLLTVAPGWLLGQKLDGVYTGRLITESNALVLRSTGEVVIGNVFLTEYEKFTFLGTVEGDSLKATILVPGGSEVVVVGRCYKDSISLDLYSNESPKHTSLTRVSSKPNYNLRKYFGGHDPFRDPLLVGKWNIVKNISVEGKESTSRQYYYEYLSNGLMKFDMAGIMSQLQDDYRKHGGTKKIELDERMMPESTWQTSGQKLIIDSEIDLFGSGHLEYTYSIKNDTLTLINFKGGKEIMKRESRRK